MNSRRVRGLEHVARIRRDVFPKPSDNVVTVDDAPAEVVSARFEGGEPGENLLRFGDVHGVNSGPVGGRVGDEVEVDAE